MGQVLVVWCISNEFSRIDSPPAAQCLNVRLLPCPAPEKGVRSVLCNLAEDERAFLRRVVRFGDRQKIVHRPDLLHVNAYAPTPADANQRQSASVRKVKPRHSIAVRFIKERFAEGILADQSWIPNSRKANIARQ